jgi:hypothetical protein
MIDQETLLIYRKMGIPHPADTGAWVEKNVFNSKKRQPVLNPLTLEQCRNASIKSEDDGRPGPDLGRR